MLKKISGLVKFAGVCLIVWLIWFSVGIASFRGLSRIKVWLGDPTLAETGQFGDSFGATTSLFSAMGFAGVIYALILQASDRKQAAESEEKSAKLALLTALIHARAALVAMNQTQIDYLRKIEEGAKETIRQPNDLLDDELKHYLELRSKDMKDLFGIAHYAGIESGWHENREKTLDDLEAQDQRERSEAHDRLLEKLSSFGPV